jgi:hypothetical protein
MSEQHEKKSTLLLTDDDELVLPRKKKKRLSAAHTRLILFTLILIFIGVLVGVCEEQAWAQS